MDSEKVFQADALELGDPTFIRKEDEGVDKTYELKSELGGLSSKLSAMQLFDDLEQLTNVCKQSVSCASEAPN